MITRKHYVGIVSDVITSLISDWKDLTHPEVGFDEKSLSKQCKHIEDTLSFSSMSWIGNVVFSNMFNVDSKYRVPNPEHVIESVSITKILNTIESGILDGEYEIAFVNYIYLVVILNPNQYDTMFKLIKMRSSQA